MVSGWKEKACPKGRERGITDSKQSIRQKAADRRYQLSAAFLPYGYSEIISALWYNKLESGTCRKKVPE